MGGEGDDRGGAGGGPLGRVSGGIAYGRDISGRTYNFDGTVP